MQVTRQLLGELGHDPRAAESRHFLAQHLAFGDYFVAARAYSVNQAFWADTFLGRANRDGTCLVVETRLGTVTSALAPFFAQVLSWHRSEAAAALSRKWLHHCGATNVTVAVGEGDETIAEPAAKFAAIVIVGPAADPSAQWGVDFAATIHALLLRVPQLLAPDGQLIVADNNRWSYRGLRAGGRHPGLALPVLKHRVGAQFRHTDIYVCGAALTSCHSPLPDLFKRESIGAGSSLPKNRLSALKSQLLNLPLARLLWPSFLLIASNADNPSALAVVLRQERIARAMGWAASERIEVKRIVAGNSGTSIVICGPSQRESADVVLRIPSDANGERFCRINSRALTLLAASKWAGLVPRAIDQGALGAHAYYMESRCPGFEVYSDTSGLPEMVRRACLSMSELHLATSSRSVLSETDFDRRIAPLIDDIAGYCEPAVSARLLVLKSRLRTRMRNCPVALGYLHGDFKLGNILFDEAGNLTALIDWDGFSESGFQLFDYLTLLTYKISGDTGLSMPELYVRFLLHWRLPDYYAGLVDQAIAPFVVDEESFRCVRIVFWFSLLAARFEPLWKYHREWHRRFLDPVLAAMEEVLAIEAIDATEIADAATASIQPTAASNAGGAIG